MAIKVSAKDISFFRKHAGYSYRPGKETRAQGRTRAARQLATAERVRVTRGVPVLWEHDREPYDPGDTNYEPGEVFCARIPDASGRGSLASLCGIADPDAAYRRVVEAELALEAFGTSARTPVKRRRR
jgi:hypothetical protein